MSLQEMEELKAKLSTYKEQLQQVLVFGAQVKESLVVEPGNGKYQYMAKGLTEGTTTSLHAREDLSRSCFARSGQYIDVEVVEVLPVVCFEAARFAFSSIFYHAKPENARASRAAVIEAWMDVHVSWDWRDAI